MGRTGLTNSPHPHVVVNVWLDHFRKPAVASAPFDAGSKRNVPSGLTYAEDIGCWVARLLGCWVSSQLLSNPETQQPGSGGGWQRRLQNDSRGARRHSAR